MVIDEKKIEEITRGVVKNLLESTNSNSLKISHITSSGDGLFNNIEDAITAAKEAQVKLISLGREARYRIIANIRKRCLENIERFAKLAEDETGLGRYEDKIMKNKVAINFSPGPEDIKLRAYSNEVSTINIGRAPYGLIAAITPMTNHNPGIINNYIIMISSGNSVVFLPHPSAHQCSTSVFY